MELEHKTALVTGAGAVGGIGYEIAAQLAAEGAEVIISGRDSVRGEEAARALGGKTRFVHADLTKLDEVEALAKNVGDVDILVNNAAAFTAAPTAEQDSESFDSVFDSNVRGPYFLTAALAPKMMANGGGSIINISTMVAQIGMPGMSVYSASKAAVESLTRTWAAEFAAGGVRVNTVSPGPTLSAKFEAPEAAGLVQQLGQTTALKRAASTSEIAEVVVFLAGDRSSYVTGATIPADGGRTAI